MRGDPSLSALFQNHTSAAWREREDKSEPVTNFHTTSGTVLHIGFVLIKGSEGDHWES